MLDANLEIFLSINPNVPTTSHTRLVFYMKSVVSAYLQQLLIATQFLNSQKFRLIYCDVDSDGNMEYCPTPRYRCRSSSANGLHKSGKVWGKVHSMHRI
jgi:hypothetical protein